MVQDKGSGVLIFSSWVLGTRCCRALHTASLQPQPHRQAFGFLAQGQCPCAMTRVQYFFFHSKTVNSNFMFIMASSCRLLILPPRALRRRRHLCSCTVVNSSAACTNLLFSCSSSKVACKVSGACPPPAVINHKYVSG